MVKRVRVSTDNQASVQARQRVYATSSHETDLAVTHVETWEIAWYRMLRCAVLCCAMIYLCYARPYHTYAVLDHTSAVVRQLFKAEPLPD